MLSPWKVTVTLALSAVISMSMFGCEQGGDTAATQNTPGAIETQSAMDKAESAMKDAADEVEAASQDAADAVRSAANEVGKTMSDVADTVTTKTDNAVDQARKSMANSLSNTAPTDGRGPSSLTPGQDPATPRGASRELTGSTDPLYVIAEPAVLDLGEIPTNDTKAGTITLINTGTQPMRIVDSKTSCGCTTANLPKGTDIQPGEEIEVEIRLKGGSTESRLNKTVTFIVEGQPPLVLPVKAQSKAFVHVEPTRLDPQTMPEGKVVLQSIDEAPFKITRMHPPVIESFGEESSKEHELTLDWDRWKELGGSARLTVYTDHPKASQVLININPRIIAQQKPMRPDRGRNLNARADGNVKGAEQPNHRERPAVDAAQSPNRVIRQGNSEGVIAKIEAGTLDVNIVDERGSSMLAVAAEVGDMELVKVLLEHGADVEAVDRLNKTPLMHAGEGGQPDVVRVLLDAGASVSARDTLGSSALSWAAFRGDPTSVSELIDAGSDLEVVGPLTGFTPLIWASGFNKNPEVVERLIKAGANVNAADFAQGATPVMHAARTGENANLKLLIEADADLEAKEAQGLTALLMAASASGATAETVQILIDAGADLTATDTRGNNALDLAAKRTDPRAAAVYEVLKEHIKPAEAKAEESDAKAEQPKEEQPESE